MKLNRNYITPFISLVFLVVGITGVLMYFHLFGGYTEIVHEFLGLFFVVCAVFHILVNWKALKIHFKRGLIIPTTIAVTFISILFIIQQQFNPKVDTILLDRIIKSPITDVFKALDIDSAKAVKKLDANGISIIGATNLEDIWIIHNADPEEILDLIMD